MNQEQAKKDPRFKGHWILKAEVENEDFDIVDNIFIWYNGTWKNGFWYNGTWYNGTWYNGTWYNGTWYNGTWYNGTWENGTWYNGTWKNGIWYNGTWSGKEDRILYHLSKLGIVFDEHNTATGYRFTKKDCHGLWRISFLQRSGEYYEKDCADKEGGTCCKGIHVTSPGIAWSYFGDISSDYQLWKVTFKKEDLLACDGQKARIRGGIFEKINNPFMVEEC